MATAAQLAARRRLVTAATKRHPPRSMPPAQLPRPTAYTRALTAIADELNQEIHAALADEGLPAPRADAADGDASIPAFNRGDLWARLRRIADAVVKRRGTFLDTAIEACAANVSNLTRAEWSKQAKAAVGIDLSQVEPSLTPTINAFRRANLDLITSMARDKVERVKAILEDAPNARVETIRDRIMEEGNVTRRQAALIARDQVLSLNAQVTEKRHAAAGVEKYTWRTSGDGDVRPAHRALNGKVFAYADPPVVDARKGRRENPGQDYQCRCTAEPVIDWGEELAARTDAGDFKESEHPRDHGQFTEKGGGGRGPLHAKPKKGTSGKPPTTPTTPTAGTAPEPSKAERPLPPRLEFKEPPPPLRPRLQRLPRRTDEPLSTEAHPDFASMPVQPTVQGIPLQAHAVASVQYPANRVHEDAFTKHLIEETRKATAHIPPEHVQALREYTNGAFRRANLYLRRGPDALAATYGEGARADVERVVEGTRRALEALPRAPKDMVLMRGIGISNVSELDPLARASEFTSHGFFSASRDPNIGMRYMEGDTDDAPAVLYRVTRHQSGAILSPEHSVEGEAEVLFPPGARFRIVGRQRISTTRLLLDLEEI